MGNFDVEKTIVVPDSGGSGNNFLAGMHPLVSLKVLMLTR